MLWHRTCLGIWLNLGVMLVFVVVDVALRRGSVPALHFYQSVQIFTFSACLVVLRAPWGRARPTAIALVAVATVCVAGTGGAASIGNETAFALLLVALSMGAAVFVPWGLFAQVSAVAMCALAASANIFIVSGQFLPKNSFALAVVVALGASILIAREVERHRSGARVSALEAAVHVERLAQSERQLQLLSGRILSLQEEERNQVALELHDDVGQSITAMKFLVGAIHETCADNEGQRTRTAEVLGLLDETLLSIQRLARQLRPSTIGDLGLSAAVESYAEDFERRTGVECVVVIDGAVDRSGQDASTALFRILQEALTNVARHAEASKVSVTLRRDEAAVALIVHDNGIGISEEEPAPSSSLGLLGMRERARRFRGDVWLRRDSEGGTVLKATVNDPRPEAEPNSR